MKTVAAIFAHPDDEVLGCGATLALHAARGDRVRILILATGLTSRGAASAQQLAHLRQQGQASAKILGASEIEFADFPDNALDTVGTLPVARRVEEFLAAAAPDTIYTHHAGDLNVDHRLVQLAVVTACRPLPDAGDVEIHACEVPSSTEWAPPALPHFVPVRFVDVHTTLEHKIAAMACYAAEVRAWPHPRSAEALRALAHWRGSQCGRQAAEAFSLVRSVTTIS